jgi:hypothetical protein
MVSGFLIKINIAFCISGWDLPAFELAVKSDSQISLTCAYVFTRWSRLRRGWLCRRWLDRSRFRGLWFYGSRPHRLWLSRRDRGRFDRSRLHHSGLNRRWNHGSRLGYSGLNRRWGRSRSRFRRSILLHGRSLIFFLGIILTTGQKQGQRQAKGKGLDFKQGSV